MPSNAHGGSRDIWTKSAVGKLDMGHLGVASRCSPQVGVKESNGSLKVAAMAAELSTAFFAKARRPRLNDIIGIDGGADTAVQRVSVEAALLDI